MGVLNLIFFLGAYGGAILLSTKELFYERGANSGANKGIFTG